MLDLQTQLYILSATFGAVIFLLIILVLVLALSVARWVHIISTNIVIFLLIILPVNQTTIFSNLVHFHYHSPPQNYLHSLQPSSLLSFLVLFLCCIITITITITITTLSTSHSATFQTFRRLAIYFLILRTFTIHPVVRFGIRFFLFLPGLKNSFMRDSEMNEVNSFFFQKKKGWKEFYWVAKNGGRDARVKV